MAEPAARMIAWPLAILFVGAACLLTLSPVAAIIVIGGCIALALSGPVGALQALAIAVVVNFGNPAIIKLSPLTGVLMRLVMVAAILRVLPLLRVSDLRLLWPVWLLTFVAAATSAATSPAFSISLMKAITFGLAVTTVLVAISRLSPKQLRRIQTWFLTLGVTEITLSGLTLAKPGFGSGLNGGLEGLLNQPQALGIFIAPFAAWTVAGVLLMRRQTNWVEVGFAIGSVVLLFLTRARTGASAFIISLGIVMLSRMLSRRAVAHAKLGRPIAIVAVIALAGIVLAVTTGKVSGLFREFAFKGTETQNRDLGEAFYYSRGGGVVQQWANFRSSPVIGHGFGVYPDGEFPSGVVKFYGIPISAPIEKGFLPTAILEECGILGGTALVILIWRLGRQAWRGSDLRWRAMFVASVAVNVGECVFLAPGGLGMLHWLFIAVAVSAYRTEPVARAIRRNDPQPSLDTPVPEGHQLKAAAA